MNSLKIIRELKTDCLVRGIHIPGHVEEALLRLNNQPLSVFEYPTTGGITLRLDERIYVNAPFHGAYAKSAKAVLDYVPDKNQFYVKWRDQRFAAEILPLPGYLNQRLSTGEYVSDMAMSHADRIRISPVKGCFFQCAFCDAHLKPYHQHSTDKLMEALAVALADEKLPAAHVLISGGTPGPGDMHAQDDLYERIIRECPLSVDVMLAPRPNSVDIIDRLVSWGVNGLFVNPEIFDERIGKKIMPQKHAIGRNIYQKYIERAVGLTGGNGRVRALLIAGLEPVESTLKGTEWIARMGCDPVISPFRPAPGTPLEAVPGPGIEDITRIWDEASETAESFGVKIGSRCIPCQHNALAFPDDSGVFFFSKEFKKT